MTKIAILEDIGLVRRSQRGRHVEQLPDRPVMLERTSALAEARQYSGAKDPGLAMFDREPELDRSRIWLLQREMKLHRCGHPGSF